MLRFANDLNILESSVEITERAAQVLEQVASKIDISINTDKTKIMELLDEGDNTNTGALDFEKVNKFRYLGAVLSTKND